MDISEKIAYIQGLADGLELEEESDEGRVIGEMLRVLSDVADHLTGLESGMDILFQQVQDLTEDFDDYLMSDNWACGDELQPGDEIIADYEGDIYQVICPYCAEEICLTEEMLDQGEVDCPVCHSNLELDFSGELDKDLLGD